MYDKVKIQPRIMNALYINTECKTSLFDHGRDTTLVINTARLVKLTLWATLTPLYHRWFHARRPLLLRRPPPATPSPQGGRPRTHGAKFACKDPTTWPVPTDEHSVEDAQYGTVRVRSWAELHPKQQTHPGRGSRNHGPSCVALSSSLKSAACRRPASFFTPLDFCGSVC